LNSKIMRIIPNRLGSETSRPVQMTTMYALEKALQNTSISYVRAFAVDALNEKSFTRDY
jgi:hypothetical protein